MNEATTRFIEIDAHTLFRCLSDLFIENKASRHEKECDECWGIGYVNCGWRDVGEGNDDSEVDIIPCAFICRHCGGTGWQYAR